MIQNKILEEHKFREHKLQTNGLVLKLKDNGFDKESSLVKSCGGYLLFSRDEHQVSKEQRRKLKEANFCKFRFCSMCNWRRVRKVGVQMIEALEEIEKKKEVSYLSLTLTIDNPKVDDLKDAVKEMNESFKRMSKLKIYKNAIIGHFKALELLGDNTKDGEIHPHFHILLVVSKGYFKSKNYISQAKWAEMWGQSLRVDYTPIVHIRRIKPNVRRRMNALNSAVLEVAKYAVKHTELENRTEADFGKIIIKTKGMRFFATGGELKKSINLMKLDEDLIGLKERTEAEWVQIEEELYRWIDGDYRISSK